MSAFGGDILARFGNAIGRSVQTGRKTPVSPIAPRVAEIVCAAAAAAAAASIVGSLIWPLPSPRVEAPRAAAGTATTATANPFGAPLAAPAAAAPALGDAADAADTALNLTLFGTWVEPGGGATATIGGAEGKQKVYRIGDPVCCGATLERVFPAHVLISRNGVVEALRLANKTPEANTPQPSPAGASATIADFSSLVALRPSVDAAGRVTLTVTAGGQGQQGLSQVGLRENDVIISVNGRPAPETMTEVPLFLESMRGGTSYNVVVRRDGAAVPISFSISASGARQEG